MSYTLIGSYTSPYVRKIRLLLWDDKTVQFKALNYLEEEGNKYLKTINPLNQIPLLLDGDKPIYESRVMFSYIAQKKRLPALTLEEENILSAIDTALSSGVNLFSLRKGGIDITSGNHYFSERQKDRIPTLLNYLTPWASKQYPDKDWNFLTMSLYSLLNWLDFREVYDIKQHPLLVEFLERFKNSPGVSETDPCKA